VPSLFVIRGNDQGSRFEFSSDVFAIGREASNDAQLHDTEISRRHAEIRRDGRRYILRDLGSSNGSFVNGRAVAEHSLASGDQIQLGRTLLLFTGVSEEGSRSSIAQRVDIVQRPADHDSRILHAVTQEEGSRIFDHATAAESPWLIRARSHLQFMYRTALAVSHTLDIDQLLERIMDLIFEWVEVDRGCVMLVDPETQKLEPKVRRDRNGARKQDRLVISRTILDYVFEHKEGVLTSDAREDARWNPAASILQQGIHEAICVPMQGRYDLVGVIYIDTSVAPEKVLQKTSKRPDKLTEEHLKLMVAIAHQAALAVEDTRYYSAMVQAERLAAVGQTIATLSHHIKNILQGIRGGSYLIELGLSETDQQLVRKGWDIVDKNQQKISNLVLDMLTFSKEREPTLGPADINQVVGDVVELIQSRATEQQVELVWTPAPDIPLMVFDAEGLHRAVLNIVTNAIDACDRQSKPDGGGRVEVATRYAQPEGLLQITIRDNGTGIAPEDLERIFTLFVSRKGSRGTGLGLSVSQKILKEHGGRIQVESKLGEGSGFTLELPALIHEPPEGPATVAPASSPRTTR